MTSWRVYISVKVHSKLQMILKYCHTLKLRYFKIFYLSVYTDMRILNNLVLQKPSATFTPPGYLYTIILSLSKTGNNTTSCITISCIFLFLFLSFLATKRFSLSWKMVMVYFLVEIKRAFPLGVPSNGVGLVSVCFSRHLFWRAWSVCSLNMGFEG